MYEPFASADSTFRLLGPAQHAPSVFNTQPWWFRILADDRIELCARIGEGSAFEHLQEHGLELADGDCRLSSVDPRARELIISCGAALFNLCLSIRVAGHDLTVQLLPYPQDRSVLATVEIVSGRIHSPSDGQQELYDAIPRRHSNRWPYGRADHTRLKADPVPPNILVAMELAAARYEGRLRALSRPDVRRWLREAESADRKLRGAEDYATELSQWTANGASNTGIPADAFGPAWERHGHWRKDHPPIRDFRAHAAGTERESSGQDDGSSEDVGPSVLSGPSAHNGHNGHNGHKAPRFERLPQLMLLSTSRNSSLDWLRAGQALQHALLTATRYGVSASFLTQPFEAQDYDFHRQRTKRQRVPVPPEPGGAAPRPVAVPPGDLRVLPPAQRDPVLRQRGRQPILPEYPQLLIRVGYATHDAGVTRREDPDVLDCRCDPPSWLVRTTGAGA